MILPGGEQNPARFFYGGKVGKTMKKTRRAKIMIVVAGGLALAGFTTPAARAATTTPNLAPGGGFDWAYSDTSSSNQSQFSGDLFINE
jgi:hypothetical protein